MDDTYYNDLLAQLRGMYITERPDVERAEKMQKELAMECQYCGGHCTIYDGGEANNYELAVYVCDDCGEWQDEEEGDDPEEEESRKATQARASANMFVWTTPYRFGAR